MRKILKIIYNAIIGCLENRAVRFMVFKTNIAERLAIFRKRKMYGKVQWTKEQKEDFDSFWKEAYGKRIPDKWNRLYESINGVFATDYIPEIIYTTEVEPALNDYQYAKILENKSLIESFASKTIAVVPETIVVCDAGRYFDGQRRPITEAEATDIVAAEMDVVIKPTVGTSSGKGVLLFDKGRDLIPASEKYGKNFIVQKKIEQCPEFAAFNPTSVNTIRIITYLVDGNIYHAPICFRTGRNGINVDNIHSGGICIGVKDSGELLPIGYELGYGDKNRVFKAHPDSGIQFEGIVLPQIFEIINTAERIHGYLPHLGIVSWDFTVNSENKVVLIEANLKGQSIWFPQIIHGKGAFGENLKAILDETKRKK